jgi:hypothetical protein
MINPDLKIRSENSIRDYPENARDVTPIFAQTEFLEARDPASGRRLV